MDIAELEAAMKARHSDQPSLCLTSHRISNIGEGKGFASDVLKYYSVQPAAAISSTEEWIGGLT